MANTLKSGAWHAKRYKYADGVSYRRNFYLLSVPIVDRFDAEAEEVVGGAIVYRDKALAYIGSVGPMDGFRTIIAVSAEYVWGSDLRDALAKLKASVPNPFEKRKPRLP
jgi:hypothetical protein